MKYVLILLLLSEGPNFGFVVPVVAEFDDFEACEFAAQTIMAPFQSEYRPAGVPQMASVTTCMPKGTPK